MSYSEVSWKDNHSYSMSLLRLKLAMLIRGMFIDLGKLYS